jgi:hypothetical protein
MERFMEESPDTAAYEALRQQLKQGQETIHQALQATLGQSGVSDFNVMRCGQGDNWDFSVTVKDHVESLLFTREEIAGSAERLNSPAAAKVSALAGRVIRHAALHAIAKHAREVAGQIRQPGHRSPSQFPNTVERMKRHGPDPELQRIEVQLGTLVVTIESYLQNRAV